MATSGPTADRTFEASRSGMLQLPSSIRYGTSLILTCAGLQATLMGQVPTKCFEIESILVDACNPIDLCPGSTEGQNEMFRFRTGPDPIALSDIDIQWPNNPWRGFEQSTLTAQLTAAMNATIAGCGWLVEPPGGIIPPGSPVIVVTSTAMCVAGNSFVALSDTVYMAFQEAGNSNGHFANHNNGTDIVSEPVGGVSLRTLIITYLPTLCGDTATYDRQLLVNVYGTYGGFAADNDGSTALFSWPGIPVVSYVNNGCLAPYDPLLVDIQEAPAAICDGTAITLEGSVSGDILSVLWQGGTGTFSDPTSPLTTYTPGAGDEGEVVLEFCAVDQCGAAICSSIALSVDEQPQITIQGNATPCVGSSTVLTAVGTGDPVWSTGETSDAITVTTGGDYSVMATNACGSAQDQISVTFVAQPEAVIEGAPYLCPQAVLTATGGEFYAWSNGANTPTIAVDSPGPYSVTVSNGCGSSTASVQVVDSPIDPGFMANTVVGEAPLLVTFTNFVLPPEADLFWDLGDGTTSTADAPVHLYGSPGVYVVTLTVTLGDCTASASLTITVLAPGTEEVSIIVPNVFSPNGDGINDALEIVTQGIERLDMYIYNRWGQMIDHLKGPQRLWTGRSSSGTAVPDGTYFYELRAIARDGAEHALRGTITVVR